MKKEFLLALQSNKGKFQFHQQLDQNHRDFMKEEYLVNIMLRSVEIQVQLMRYGILQAL